MLDCFTNKALDFDYLIKSIHNRFVIATRNDSIVNFSYTDNLANKLKADFIIFNEGNHFMDSDGFDEFPMVYHILEMII